MRRPERSSSSPPPGECDYTDLNGPFPGGISVIGYCDPCAHTVAPTVATTNAATRTFFIKSSSRRVRLYRSERSLPGRNQRDRILRSLRPHCRPHCSNDECGDQNVLHQVLLPESATIQI